MTLCHDTVLGSPTSYLSVRISAEHSQSNVVQDIFKDCVYALVKHIGEQSEGEHFHVFVDVGKEDRNKVRKKLSERIKTAFPGRAGNGLYAFRPANECNNGILCAIQYGSHPPTQESDWTFSCDCVRAWYDAAPAWVDNPKTALKHRNACEHNVLLDGEPVTLGIRVNGHNVSRYAAHFYKKNKFTHCSFKKTLMSMRSMPRYNFTGLFRDRLNEFHETDFNERIGYHPVDQEARWERMFHVEKYST